MIIAQYNPYFISALSPAGTAAAQFQAVTTVGGTPTGNPLQPSNTAGNVNLQIGQGFLFGVPFKLIMQGDVTIVTTATTVTLAAVLGTAAWFSGAQPATSFAQSTAASQSFTAGKHAFYAEFYLFADALAQTVNGHVTAEYDLTVSDRQTVAGMNQVTGLTLPSFGAAGASGPYSWTLPITGLDGAKATGTAGDGPTNAPFLFAVPQVTFATVSGSSTVNLQFFGVQQG